MGKALIVADNGEGSYQIRIEYNRARVQAERGALEDRLDELIPQLEDAERELETLELEVEEAWITVNALIDDLEEDGGPISLSDLIAQHNSYRSGKGLAVLSGSAALHSAAQGHATWLAQNNQTGHTGAGGSNAKSRITDAGYPWQDGGGFGENVAVGVPDVASAMQGWQRSPSHNSNMLNPDWQHIGVGYACRSEGAYRHFWVVCFGSSNSSVTGGSPSTTLTCEGSREGIPEAIREQMEALARVSAKRDEAKTEIALLEAMRVSMRERINAIAAMPADPVQQAWCADHTEELSGAVATAVIPGEGTEKTLVLPAFHDDHVWSAAKGQMVPRVVMSPEQVFFNAAVLPGWQRHKPLHRVGVLSNRNLSADTATVTIDEETSSANGLGIDPPSRVFTGVPITYMECDARAFENGDRVLVKFEGDWSTPRIIGFESEPRLCLEWPDVMLLVMADWGEYDDSASFTVVDTVVNGDWTFYDGSNSDPDDPDCAGWHTTARRDVTAGRTRPFGLFFSDNLKQQIYFNDEGGEDVRRVDSATELQYRWDSVGEEWVLSSLPSPLLTIEMTQTKANAFAGDGANLIFSRQENVFPNNYDNVATFSRTTLNGVFINWVTHPNWIVVPDRTAPDCGPPHPAWSAITNVTYIRTGPADTFSAYATPPPEWVPSTYEEITEIENPLDTAAIATWMIAQGLPAEIQVSQVLSGKTYTETYEFVVVEGWPSIFGSNGDYFCRYRLKPPAV